MITLKPPARNWGLNQDYRPRGYSHYTPGTSHPDWVIKGQAMGPRILILGNWEHTGNYPPGLGHQGTGHGNNDTYSGDPGTHRELPTRTGSSRDRPWEQRYLFWGSGNTPGTTHPDWVTEGQGRGNTPGPGVLRLGNWDQGLSETTLFL